MDVNLSSAFVEKLFEGTGTTGRGAAAAAEAVAVCRWWSHFILGGNEEVEIWSLFLGFLIFGT